MILSQREKPTEAKPHRVHANQIRSQSNHQTKLSTVENKFDITI